MWQLASNPRDTESSVTDRRRLPDCRGLHGTILRRRLKWGSKNPLFIKRGPPSSPREEGLDSERGRGFDIRKKSWERFSNDQQIFTASHRKVRAFTARGERYCDLRKFTSQFVLNWCHNNSKMSQFLESLYFQKLKLLKKVSPARWPNLTTFLFFSVGSHIYNFPFTLAQPRNHLW